jgi:DNA-directed RNA polymerase subunit M/transcription elongation factor TFIIS
MHFCVKCDNMYYIRLGAGGQDPSDTTSLYHYCRNCGNEDKIKETICVSKLQLKHNTQSYSNIINKYTKLDPTLPRINNIKCPNEQCRSNPPPASGGAAFMRPGIAANRNRSGGAARASVGHDLDEEEYDADVGAEAVASKHDAVAVVANIEPVPREVIYLRYDEVNMRYVYLCAVCDTLWNTSQNNIL